MTPDLTSLGIDKLSIHDRISLVHAIWDSIADENAVVPLSDVQMETVLRRAAKHDDGNGLAISWEQIRSEALARLKQ